MHLAEMRQGQLHLTKRTGRVRTGSTVESKSRDKLTMKSMSADDEVAASNDRQQV